MVNRFDVLYAFLCDRLKDYAKQREAVDQRAGLPEAVAAFRYCSGGISAGSSSQKSSVRRGVGTRS